MKYGLALRYYCPATSAAQGVHQVLHAPSSEQETQTDRVIDASSQLFVFVSCTPVLSDFFTTQQRRREREIGAWIRRHGKSNCKSASAGAKVLILDDLPLAAEATLGREKCFFHVDPSTGLRMEDVQKCAELLRGQRTTSLPVNSKD